MKKFIFLLPLIILGAGCEMQATSSTNSTSTSQGVSKQYRAVESQGFKDIKMGIGSQSPVLACSDKDSWANSDSFKAKNINNIEVDGVVCCGWFKGCTVRF